MGAMAKQFRRAPGRIIASVLALALGIGAIGVLAIPTVSESTLHAAAADDGLADINAATTPLSAAIQIVATRFFALSRWSGSTMLMNTVPTRYVYTVPPTGYQGYQPPQPGGKG